MSKKPKEERSPSFLGPLCTQLLTMCHKSRQERNPEDLEIPDENLTQMKGASSNLSQNEQNPHEDFYREAYEH